MAISRVAGQMLQSILARDGVNLSVNDTALDTPVLYVDIANSRIGVNRNNPSVALDVLGNIAANNLNVSSNVYCGNLSSTGIVNATANVIGGNLTTSGQVVATGNVTGGNLTTAGIANITGNVTGGNLLTIGLVSATGNITGGNINTGGNVTAVNVLIGNILVPSVGNINVGNTHISNLADPVQNQDAVTKYYVDQHIGNVSNIGNLSVSNTTISTSLATGNITLTPTGSALVYINTTTGLVLPVGNIAQRPAGPTGTIRYNSETGRLEVYDGAEWDSVVSDVTDQVIVPDGTSLTYTLNKSATSASVLVSINGLVQIPGPTYSYTVTGNAITFAEAPLITDIIDIRFL